MKREDCWMTFSEALEQYLSNREAKNTTTVGSQNWRHYDSEMREAAEHLDAYTSLPDDQAGGA